MGETVDDDGESTTWCDDSDSCVSASKCYCSLHDHKKNNHRKPKNVEKRTNTNNKSKSSKLRKADNLALDYELFTVSGGQQRQHVRPTEALSVKKSVEMAALFADVKLSQTTDITSLQQQSANKSDLKSHKRHHKKHNSDVVEINNGKNILNPKSDEVILRKDVELNNKRAMSKNDGYYQPIGQRPVSNSLEDSLGYLP